MFEKVNPSHPDKVADRIAGAIVDLAYKKEDDPKIAVEVLLGHHTGSIIVETDVNIRWDEVNAIVDRICAKDVVLPEITIVKQDDHLANNQKGKIRCGDNGIFKGMPVTKEQKRLTEIVKSMYKSIPCDGKYILNGNTLIACQSNLHDFKDFTGLNVIFNPLGFWTGGLDVDSGATNRKLGSDMGDSVTGGGLHGKDLSKADVSVNIYAWLKAQETGKPVELCCAIGNEYVDGKPYYEIVEIARKYIKSVGGFEKFAEWGLI